MRENKGLVSWEHKLLLGVILPIIFEAVGYFLVLYSANGKGSAIGFRAWGMFAFMPGVIGVGTVAQLWVLCVRWQMKTVMIIASYILPVLVWIVAWIYLWSQA